MPEQLHQYYATLLMTQIARFRRAFRYPNQEENHESLGLDEILDEEEQENLIQSLEVENLKANQLYARILLLPPLISISPYLRTLFRPTTTLFSILSITSLLSTAFLTIALPPGKTGITFLDRYSHSSNQAPSVLRHEALDFLTDDHGPIKRFLPYLNLGLCAILALLGTMIKKTVADLWYGFCWLPTINYGAILLAAWFMGIADPQSELRGLKYNYKGV